MKHAIWKHFNFVPVFILKYLSFPLPLSPFLPSFPSLSFQVWSWKLEAQTSILLLRTLKAYFWVICSFCCEEQKKNVEWFFFHSFMLILLLKFTWYAICYWGSGVSFCTKFLQFSSLWMKEIVNFKTLTKVLENNICFSLGFILCCDLFFIFYLWGESMLYFIFINVIFASLPCLLSKSFCQNPKNLSA